MFNEHKVLHQSLVDLDIHKTQILMGFPSLVVVAHTVCAFFVKLHELLLPKHFCTTFFLEYEPYSTKVPESHKHYHIECVKIIDSFLNASSHKVNFSRGHP